MHILLALLLAIASAASAADCPGDAFGLWSAGILRGANVFQGRNPGGASNGFGDGDFAQSDFADLSAAGANYVQISHAGTYARRRPTRSTRPRRRTSIACWRWRTRRTCTP